MTVIADFIRSAMTAIAVKDSRVARGNIAQPEDKPERQNQPEANTLCSGHFDTIAILTTVAVSISRADRVHAVLFGQAVEHIHRLYRLTWFPECSEPPVIDFDDSTRTIQPGQSTIHCKPKCSIIAPEHKPVRLVGE